MTKSFFIVVSYSAPALGGTTAIKKSFFGGEKSSKKEQEKTTFEESRSQLQQRVEVVEQGLVRCGVRIANLGTEELIELFYKTFNPGDVEKPIHLTPQK